MASLSRESPVPSVPAGGRAGRVGRRRLARATGLLVAGAVVGVEGLLAGCATSPAATPSAAKPTVASNKVTLYYSAGGYESTRSAASLQAVQELLQTHFLAKHPSLDLRVNWNYHGDSSGLISAMIAGAAPDVFEEWQPSTLLKHGAYCLDLSPYIRKANLNLAQFLPGELETFRTTNGEGVLGQWGLPAYVHQMAMAVNLDVLDSLGLAYPSPQWDWQEAEALWKGATKRDTNPAQGRTGGAFLWFGGGPMSFYLHGWGASYVDPADTTRCVVDSPQAVSFGDWHFGLLQSGAATLNNSRSGFAKGQLVCAIRGTDGGLAPSVVAWRGTKWRFYPMPTWPRGKFTACYSDFHGIWSGTKHPDASWELVQFLSTDLNWQRGLMHLYLNGPALKALWPEWAATVVQVAPPLKDKNVEVFVQQVQDNMPMYHNYFEYDTVGAFGIISSWMNRILNRKATVRGGFAAAAQQTNAFEAALKSVAPARSQAAKAFPSTGPGIAKVPAGL